MLLDGSNGEGASAAAGLSGVGVGEIEAAADQRSAEVQLHSIDVEQLLGSQITSKQAPSGASY